MRLSIAPERRRAVDYHTQKARALVGVIGQTVYNQLFPLYQSAIGAQIQVKGTPMEVIGLLAAKGQTSYRQDQDDVVMVPFMTAHRRVLGVAAPNAQQAPRTIIRAEATALGVEWWDEK
jgi:macrolide transport system ATP-binding/permease protein